MKYDKRELIEQLRFIRFLQQELKFKYTDTLKRMIDNEKREYRKSLRVYNSFDSGVTVIDDSVTYPKWKQIRTVEFNGTKQELFDRLWEDRSVITSDHDCTGQVFTAGLVVAHMRDNLFKVCEIFKLDV